MSDETTMAEILNALRTLAVTRGDSRYVTLDTAEHAAERGRQAGRAEAAELLKKYVLLWRHLAAMPGVDEATKARRQAILLEVESIHVGVAFLSAAPAAREDEQPEGKPSDHAPRGSATEGLGISPAASPAPPSEAEHDAIVLLRAAAILVNREIRDVASVTVRTLRDEAAALRAAPQEKREPRS